KMMTGLNLVQVPYRSNYMPDVLGGQVPVAFVAVAAAAGYLDSGKLRGLGVTSATRMSALPDIPPIGDFVPGYEGSGWLGVGAPKDTPPSIIDTLNKSINAIISDPKMKARLVDLGVETDPMTPAQFGKVCADATEKWARVIKFAGIKVQ
ncbi:MAG: tripartite tricarboxylate transporter substrate-binding protein, partial [Xanthobacteraceae bacterium]